MEKNSIGRIIFVISLILVIVCFVMVASTTLSNSMGSNDVEWNNMTFLMESSMTYEESEDSINFTGQFDSENVEIRFTNDTSNYNNSVVADDMSIYSTPFNRTHIKIVVPSKNCIFIVPNEIINDKALADSAILDEGENLYALKGNGRIIEMTGSDIDFMESFILSAQ